MSKRKKPEEDTIESLRNEINVLRSELDSCRKPYFSCCDALDGEDNKMPARGIAANHALETIKQA